MLTVVLLVTSVTTRSKKIRDLFLFAFQRMGEGDCWNSIIQGTLVRVSPKMLMGRASTFPPSSNHHQPQTPRASSEHEARSEPRTSLSDEAQACFNLVLILRNDTQHLISLRNDNLQSFEEVDTARPLLTQINSAITAATRSIHELGPFLERHRWPPCEPPRASIIRLKILRKRSRSLSSPVAGAGTTVEPGLSPDELFSWTLALTAQHTAVLAALDQLEKFLVYGSADISEDDRRRHDATGSWWQQRHSEFENVTLIQSILQRPRRNFRAQAGASMTTPAVDITENAHFGDAVSSSPAAAAIIPSVTEHDDGRSDTLTFSEQSIKSWPGEIMNGLTARPRTRNEGSPQAHSRLTYKPLDLRITDLGAPVFSESGPTVAVQTERCSGPPIHLGSEQRKEAEQDTQGTEVPLAGSMVMPELPLSRFNSSARRPRITTTPLPPLVGLQTLIPDTSQRARSATLDPYQVGHAVSPLSPSSPLLSPPGLSRHSSRVSLPSPVQPSPADTPFTPLNQRVANMFEQKTLPSKTIQPVIHELDHMITSPVYSMQPVFEVDVSPVGNSHHTQSPATQEDEKHWPYLAYMARKQAVAMSRWSVRRSQSTKSKGGE